ncbi:hypothetical protein EDC01DRAFT_675361 [Geopyxis carbonaria]|nr:hypothetical protein EDC01DRAFT_675361 [Geopyxis carbonaria]
MQMPSSYVFRAVGLPMDATISDLQELRRFLKDGEELNLIDETIVPSCSHDGTLTGLFGVQLPLPCFLAKKTGGSRPIIVFSLRGEDVQIDRNFFGFTQLYHTEKEQPIIADIIAITGFEGHAYDSWEGQSHLQRMWLRDFFPKHFPNCRTMTYGYDSGIKSNSIYKLVDYSRTFLRALEKVRKSDMEAKRPLIFIGHCFGGIILAQSLVQAKFDSTGDNGTSPSDYLLKSTYGILFFGTPHRGMLVPSLLDVNSGHEQWKEFVEEIKIKSRTLEMQRVSFTNLCTGLKIYSFFERDYTRQVVIRPDGSWSREGELALSVKAGSALLQLPDSIEEKIPVDGDHFNMVQFETPHCTTYREVRSIIEKILLEAPEAIRSRFVSYPAVARNFAYTKRGTNIAALTGHEANRLQVAKVPVHFFVPFSRNGQYIGRSTKHAYIEQKLLSATGHRRLALWGLGGVGKTQDILDYVYKFQGRVSVFWIHAANAARFKQDYRRIAVLLNLPGHDDPKTDILPKVKAWFESPTSGDWILVLDNADNLLDFYPHNLEGEDRGLAKLLPHGSKGTMLVTTRDRSLAEKLAENVILKHEMNVEEAMQLFKDRCPKVGEEEEAASLLLKELHCLPLAVVQAAAYIRQSNLLSASGYLQQFKATKKNQISLLSKPFSDLRRESSLGGTETILATLAITLEQIQKQWPLAWSFLETMACIDRQGIPQGLFCEKLSDDTDANAAGEALSRLIDFALITETIVGEDRWFEMPAIVHVSIQDYLSIRKSLQTAMNKTGSTLLKLLPKGEHANWSVWKIYLPHALAWVNNGPMLSEVTARVYFLMSSYLNSIGRYNDAQTKIEASLEMQKSIPDADNGNGLDLLALIYGNQGRWSEAEELGVKLLETRKRVLGPEHPDTLEIMKHLASAYRGQGRVEEAEELGLTVLEKRKRVLGPEHPDTLSSMSNLAYTYRKQERWEEAEELEETVLEKRKRVLGPEHPDTLSSMSNLAYTYMGQGQLEEAEKLGLTVLETSKMVLGTEHPHTLTRINNLASTYRKQGRWEEAEELGVTVLETSKRVLGAEHPHTLKIMKNLASTYGGQGRLEEAEELGVTVLEMSKRILGAEHPHTLEVMKNLASIRPNPIANPSPHEYTGDDNHDSEEDRQREGTRDKLKKHKWVVFMKYLVSARRNSTKKN